MKIDSYKYDLGAQNADVKLCDDVVYEKELKESNTTTTAMQLMHEHNCAHYCSSNN